MLLPVVPHEPMKSGIGDWGLCPACECGGRERPCWNCGNDKGFTMGVGHLVLSPLAWPLP